MSLEKSRSNFLVGCWEYIRCSIHTYWLVFYRLVIFQRSENSFSFYLLGNNQNIQKFIVLEKLDFFPACLTLSQISMFWHETFLHFFFLLRINQSFSFLALFQIPLCKSFSFSPTHEFSPILLVEILLWCQKCHYFFMILPSSFPPECIFTFFKRKHHLFPSIWSE